MSVTNRKLPHLDRLRFRREALIARFLEDGEIPFLKPHTRLLDEYFHEAYESSAVGPRLAIDRNPYTLVALGGYGRQEQCIHSDIDLLFLFDRNVPDAASDLVGEIVYPLWDIGLDVGHATRSLEDCIQRSLEDIELLTAVLDARFICGMSTLYSNLMERLREKIVYEQSEAVIDRLIRRNEARHEQFGDATYLLEPNLKEGHGGLRDYHTMLWIGRIKNNLRQPRDLEYYGWLSHEEYRTVIQALEFIWKVRNHLHYLAGRKLDQLYFQHQEKVAETLGYDEENGQQPVERFLGDLHRYMNFLKQQERMRVYEIESEKLLRRARRGNRKTTHDGIEVVNGMLIFSASEKIGDTPEILIRIFEESARLNVPLAAESKRLIREFLYLVNGRFRKSSTALASFKRILMTRVPRFNVLEAMLETDFLPEYIPMFRMIQDRIQYDEYHLYPVDKHLLRTVQIVKKFGTPDDPTGKPLCGEIYRELTETEKEALLWAALCHDIGKGSSKGNHSETGERMVRQILEEKGYDTPFVETVATLVRDHLLLIKIATRRDIMDEETAIFCARRIQHPSRLRQLYLLAVADSVATGPKAWNSWVGSLLETLFLNIMSTLENGELTSAEAVEMMDFKKDHILSRADSPEKRERIQGLLKFMSPRYLLYTSADRIERHIGLFNALGEDDFIWEVETHAEADVRTVTICAKDCPGLFSKIAGVFTLHGIDILNAQVFTWRNNIALDVFEVKPPPDRYYEDQKWADAETDLAAALSGRLDLAPALEERMALYGVKRPKTAGRPHRVSVDNRTSGFFTIIEVFTYDFPGLLHGITDALFRCRLDVWIAKIATKVDQVVDVFYVRDFDGQKVDAPDQVAAITAAVKAFLGRSAVPG